MSISIPNLRTYVHKILPVKGLAAVAPLAPAVPGGLDPLAVPGGRRPWLVRKACWNPETKDKVV